MTVTKVILFCDESGAKGYADQDEASDGEVGVFAGIMLPENLIPTVSADFQAIYDRYKPTSGKFHVADLDRNARQALREEIFNAITVHQLPCFWYAVHVAGFHDYHRQLRDSKEQSYLEQQSRNPDIRLGSFRALNPSLHVALFQGLYSLVVAYLAEREQKRVEIDIRSDNIDAPLLKEFEDAAVELLSDQPTVHRNTAFHAVKKQVLERQIIIQAILPDELELEIVVERLVIDTDHADDPLVLAADVLANSLNHHFLNRPSSEKYEALNHREAILGHPLHRSLDTYWDWSVDLLGDRTWSHPKAAYRQKHEHNKATDPAPDAA